MTCNCTSKPEPEPEEAAPAGLGITFFACCCKHCSNPASRIDTASTSKMQPLLRLLPLLTTLQALTIIEQSLHKLHRPPSANHAEVPERLESAKAALLASDVKVKAWRNAVNSTTCTVFDAVDALKLVHDVDHLREVQAMSQTGGGFDTDTYCAPGSWEAVLDGTRAWADAVALAARAGDALVEEDAQVAAFFRRGAAEVKAGAPREEQRQEQLLHSLPKSIRASSRPASEFHWRIPAGVQLPVQPLRLSRPR